MTEYKLTQGTTVGTLDDLYFSPVSSAVEDNTPYVIEASIQATSDTVFENGPAEISFDGKSFPVVVSVGEFDEEEDEPEDLEEDEKNPACYLWLESETLDIEGLAELLELTE
jgi:hypothetical protein